MTQLSNVPMQPKPNTVERPNKEKFIVGEIYVMQIIDSHNDFKSTPFFRAICTGKNNIGDVGFFLDKKGKVFNETGNLYCYLESELPSHIDKSLIVDEFPLQHGFKQSHMAEFAEKYLFLMRAI